MCTILHHRMCRMLHTPTPPAPTRRRFAVSRQEGALLAITALWGSTFLVVHLAMQHSGPWFFVGLRFAVAGLLGLVVFHRALRGMRWRDIGAGAAIGVSIALGYGLQTMGLQTISSSTSAFITALYVPLVPLLQWLVFRRAPRPLTLVGVALAFVGLLLLAGPDALTIGLGPGDRRATAGGGCGRLPRHADGGRAGARLLVGVAAAGGGTRHRQLRHPAHDELGAALGVADAGDDHLRGRAGLGGRHRP